VRRLARLVWVRRVAILSVALVGLGLFASGVRGLTQIDDHLAVATKSPSTHQVKQELDPPRDDCPWSQRDERRL
jgi:hypothetical protein